jgi:hypothetical protein
VADPLALTLEHLYRRWKAWLRFRYPSLSARHADLLQDAAADLTEYVRRFPADRFGTDELARIGFSILKRRVADSFRERTIEWSEHADAEPPDLADPRADPGFVGRYAKLLRLVVGYVAKLDGRDRELLMRKADTDHAVPMTDSERQRLSRLRQRLREEILAKHGIDIRAYLREPG